jgi:hypothetical protein
MPLGKLFLDRTIAKLIVMSSVKGSMDHALILFARRKYSNDEAEFMHPNPASIVGHTDG